MKLSRLLCLLVSLAFPLFAADPVITTGTLPDDRIIFPEKAPEEGDVMVAGRLKSDVILSEVTQGNWVRKSHLLTYEVSGKPFPHRELSFLCVDSEPAKDSGIMVKKVAWPFRPEVPLVFSLRQDESCTWMQSYRITGYRKALEQ